MLPTARIDTSARKMGSVISIDSVYISVTFHFIYHRSDRIEAYCRWNSNSYACNSYTDLFGAQRRFLKLQEGEMRVKTNSPYIYI